MTWDVTRMLREATAIVNIAAEATAVEIATHRQLGLSAPPRRNRRSSAPKRRRRRVPRCQKPQTLRHSVLFRLLSVSRKQSARYCAGADKLGDGAGNGFGLLQQHEVSRTGQVDNPDALAELLAERVTIARRSHFIIEPLDHEKRSCSGAPPLVERHPPAGREVGENYPRPA